MALNLSALSNIRPMTDPAVRYRSLADLRAMAQEETTRSQQQQLNALDIQGKQTANDEWGQVKAIFDKHAGDKEGAIAEVLQRPWRSKEITDTYQNEARKMRDEAVSNAALSQGQPAPEITAAAPQTTTAQIQTSLTDPSQMSSPQVSAPATQQVPTPLKQVRIPFGGPTVQPRSAQQAFNDLIRTKQAESDIAQEAKIAESRATREAKSDVKLDETYRNGHRIIRMQRPDNSQYEVDAGVAEAAPAGSSPILREYQDAVKQGYKGSFEQYQNEDANRKKPVTTINNVAPGNFDKSGDEFLATIPVQWRATVKKIAHYDEDATKVASMRGGMREQLMQWVNQVNPNYNAILFGNLAPARKAFTLGTQGQQINAINTAIGHIDQITALGAKLDNGNVVKGNEFWNWAKTAFGADAATNFDTLKDALAGEVASVLSKSGATVSGIADAKGKIHAASSPAQLAGYVKTLIPVMGSKLNALDYEYQQATGGNDPTFSALSPEAKSILRKNGIDPENPLGGSRTSADSPYTPQRGQQPSSGLIRVQIPGHPPGEIPANQLQQFLSDNPGARQLQ